MNYSDSLELNKLKFFVDLRERLPKSIRKVKCNLLACKDDLVYAWDSTRNCVLALNLKAARGPDGPKVDYQNLWGHVSFQPEFLHVNDSNTLLVIGSRAMGVVVMEMPPRFPPYGAFLEEGVKDVHCKSHQLEEHLFGLSTKAQVRQIKFHPGSVKNNHFVVLASDNTLRLYSVENSSIHQIKTLHVGETPLGCFPGTKTTILDALGEVAVDFDFGQPKVVNTLKKMVIWPIFLLRSDGTIFNVRMSLEDNLSQFHSKMTEIIQNENPIEETCSIVCLNTTPEIICVANSNGTIYQSILLENEDGEAEEEAEKRHKHRNELFCRERIQLELGITLSEGDDIGYTCPITLHKDNSRPGRYFATHAAGIHVVNITWSRKLQQFSMLNLENNYEENLVDIFHSESQAEYLLCTKASNTLGKANEVIGFALFYSPLSLIGLLSDGSVISLAILTCELNELANYSQSEQLEGSKSKQMQQFNCSERIEKVLSESQMPILRLGVENEKNLTQKELYNLTKMAVDKLRQRLNVLSVREEIVRRAKALELIENQQEKECERMEREREMLQAKLMASAEKYEELIEKQTILTKRCELLVALVPQKRAEVSDAQMEFFEQVEKFKEQMHKYEEMLDKLKKRSQYQNVQIQNWKHNQELKVRGLKGEHAETINNNLKHMSEKIGKLVEDVNEFTGYLNLS